MVKPTRRRLLLGAAAVAAAGAGAGYALLRPDPVAVLARRLAGLFPEIAGAPPALRPVAVAAAGSAEPPELARALLGPSLLAAARAGDADLIGRLAEAVRDDYQAARTAMVEGWMLSLTEIRILAFLATAPA